MEEAERIAREEHGSEKLAVISGVGTRHYYRKLGYGKVIFLLVINCNFISFSLVLFIAIVFLPVSLAELDGPYMSKSLL